MALLITAAVVVLTVYSGGLFWLIFLIPILIITAIQNPLGALWIILFFIGGVGLFCLFGKTFEFLNTKYQETVAVPQQKNKFEKYQQEQLIFLQNQIDLGLFSGNEDLMREIVNYIKTTNVFDTYRPTWRVLYYEHSNNFIKPYMLEDDNPFADKYRKQVEENKLKNRFSVW